MTPALQARVLKILRFDRPAARGLWWRLAPQVLKKERGWRRGLCRRVVVRFAQGATAPLALRVVVAASPQFLKGAMSLVMLPSLCGSSPAVNGKEQSVSFEGPAPPRGKRPICPH